jgi:hypothetical protein
MESADFRELDDPAEFRRLDLSGLRRILAERQMRARSVVVAEIASQNSSQMTTVAGLTRMRLSRHLLQERASHNQKCERSPRTVVF